MHLRTFLLVSLLLGATACTRPEESPMPAPKTVPAGESAFAVALFQTVGERMEPGHQIALVHNGHVFDVMEREIRAAKKSVDVVIYIWRPSEPSDRMLNALAERRKAAGIACRIMVDPIGSTPAFQQEVQPRLAEMGCEVRTFRALGTSQMGVTLARNHRKIVVIDGRVGITGGFGIWQSWMGNGRAREEWRDDAVRVEGPAVAKMQVAFAQNWQESGGALLGKDEFPTPARPGRTNAAFVRSSAEVGPTAADRLTQLLIATAKKRLWISNAYFVPPDNLLELLARRSQEGVDVRVLAAGPIHDVPPIRDGQRAGYAKLIQAGVRVFEYQPSMMHSKSLIVDDWLGAVGSANLDPLSLNALEEGVMVFEDPRLVAQMAAAFEEDVKVSKEISLTSEEIPGVWGTLSRGAFRWVGEGPGR